VLTYQDAYTEKVIYMLTATACLQIPEEKKYHIDVIQMPKHWYLV